MSELIDCINNLSVKDIIRRIAKTGNGMPFYLQTSGLGGFCAEYQAVYDAMTNKPSVADSEIQNIMFCAWVDAGLFAKTELFDMFSVHSNAANEALINWRSPGTFDPASVNAPVWTQYAGFKGNIGPDRTVRLNFIPSVNGTIIGQNNQCAIIGVGDHVVEDPVDFGATSSLPTTRFQIRSINAAGNFAGFWNNDNTLFSSLNANTKKYFAVSRGNAANYDTYQNLVKTNRIQASIGMVSLELYTCGSNFIGGISPNNKTIRFAIVCSYLTEPEINTAIGIIETYLDNYGTGLIP